MDEQARALEHKAGERRTSGLFTTDVRLLITGVQTAAAAAVVIQRATTCTVYGKRVSWLFMAQQVSRDRVNMTTEREREKKWICSEAERNRRLAH